MTHTRKIYTRKRGHQVPVVYIHKLNTNGKMKSKNRNRLDIEHDYADNVFNMIYTSYNIRSVFISKGHIYRYCDIYFDFQRPVSKLVTVIENFIH